jgi:hypothetical protein
MTSLLAQMPKDVRQRVYVAIIWTVGFCPAGCDTEPCAVIFRSSRRSITLRCRHCGLLWTVTVHQLAKVVRAKAEKTKGTEVGEVIARMAREFDGWADAVGDTRGRRAREGKPS